jgi:tRNA nucleotidyltransferase (CCA-adding enzyme)
VLTLADKQDITVYVVGGAVRDLLLGNPHVDVDLCVEGDAIKLARLAARKLDVRVVAHPRFGTATIEGAGFALDLARARSERYDRPGALPKVRFGSLADDLGRRDFTINAMALRLTGRPGQLIDPFGGRADLDRGLIRVLHDQSFQDDASRVLRAFRYAGRLGFRIEGHTRAILHRDVSYLDTISGARLRSEFERIAQEKRPGAIVAATARSDALETVHPALRPGARTLRAVSRITRLPSTQRDAVLFALLLADAPYPHVEPAIERLSLRSKQAAAVRGLRSLQAVETQLGRPGLRPSAVARLLAPHSVEAIEAFALIASSLAASRARRYVVHWRHVRPRLNGRDVQALGVAPGPKLGRVLEALHEARLDGTVRSRRGEEALVMKMRDRRRRALRGG